jgi:hypothetical protein
MVEDKLVIQVLDVELASFLHAHEYLLLDLVVTSGGSFHEDCSLWEVSLLVYLEVRELHFKIHFQRVGKSHGVCDQSNFWLNTISDVDHVVVSLNGCNWRVHSIISERYTVFKFLQWIHCVAEDSQSVSWIWISAVIAHQTILLWYLSRLENF